MEGSALEEGAAWAKFQKGEKFDTLEEVEVLFGDSE